MRKFFNEMKRVDERIVDTLHIHRSVHLAKLMVQFSPPVGAGLMMCHTALCMDDCFRNSAECAARVRTDGGSFRGFRLLLDSSGVLRLQFIGKRLH